MQNMAQFAYNTQLAVLAGDDVRAAPLPAWREKMYAVSGALSARIVGLCCSLLNHGSNPALTRDLMDNAQVA